MILLNCINLAGNALPKQHRHSICIQNPFYHPLTLTASPVLTDNHTICILYYTPKLTHALSAPLSLYLSLSFIHSHTNFLCLQQHLRFSHQTLNVIIITNPLNFTTLHTLPPPLPPAPCPTGLAWKSPPHATAGKTKSLSSWAPPAPENHVFQ